MSSPTVLTAPVDHGVNEQCCHTDAFIISFLFSPFFLPSVSFLPSLSRPFLAYPLPLSCSLQKSLWSTSNSSLHHWIAAFSNIHSSHSSLLCCPSHFSWAAPLVQRQFVHILLHVLPLAQPQVTMRLLGHCSGSHPAGWYPLRVFLHCFLCSAAISLLRLWHYLRQRPPLCSVFMQSLMKQNSASFFGLQELWY